jgi:muramoyltetrapeptide carboxypeptidase
MEKLLRLNKYFYFLWFGACLWGCGLDESILTREKETLINAVEEGKISVIAPASWIGKKEEIYLKKQYPLVWDKIQPQFLEGYVFLSNSDLCRLSILLGRITDEISDVMWALRGGYGSARVMPSLFKIQGPVQQKWLIGYSDITSLHLFVSQVWGWKSIHGAVFKEILEADKDPKNFQYLEAIISEKVSRLTYKGLRLLNKENTHKTSGKLTGGNVTLLSMSIGTSWQLKAKDKIIIIEDSGYGYKLDQVLQHIRNSKILDNAAAIIIGDIISWDIDASRLINDFIQDLKMPVFKADFFGHGKKNYPWVYNADAIIELTPDGDYQLSFNIN